MKNVIKKLKINKLVFYISILNKKKYKLNDSLKFIIIEFILTIKVYIIN